MQQLHKLIAWRLIGPDKIIRDIWTVSDFSNISIWGDPALAKWTLTEAMEHLQQDCGDGYTAECRIISWPANAI